VDSRELALTRDPGRTFVARASPVARAGGGGAVLVLHDITDLRRADQIRRDFVANVSHELRTPLTAIRGYVEALLDADPDSEDTHKFLEIIARHSARMERLVSDSPAAGAARCTSGVARPRPVRPAAAVQHGRRRRCRDGAGEAAER
jgi:signal transduction histidine kinase